MAANASRRPVRVLDLTCRRAVPRQAEDKFQIPRTVKMAQGDWSELLVHTDRVQKVGGCPSSPPMCLFSAPLPYGPSASSCSPCQSPAAEVV